MSKNWLLVITAAMFEIGWVTGLKYAHDVIGWVLTIIAIVISFGGLIYASKTLPASTVYAVFVGIGTAGTVLTEMVWFNVPFSWIKIFLIVLLLTGIIGLKVLTSKNEEIQDGERV